MIYIGIDPGLTGAVAILQENAPPIVHDMPTMAYGKSAQVGRALDCAALAAILYPFSRLGFGDVFVERVGAFPGQGVSSTFSLGMSYWGAVGVARALEFPVHLVEPRTWKSFFQLDADKAKSLTLARSLYPGVGLKLKRDHNRAEALLIARYGRIGWTKDTRTPSTLDASMRSRRRSLASFQPIPEVGGA